MPARSTDTTSKKSSTSQGRTTNARKRPASKAATKRAAKKVTKKVAKKVAKKAAKKVTKRVAKRTTRKASPSKSNHVSGKSATAKATSAPRVSQSTTASKRKNAAKSTRSSAAAQTVTLPDTLALRVIAKAKAFHTAFERDFAPVVHRVTYISAACFMLVGLALVGFPALQQANSNTLTAQVSSATTSDQTEAVEFQLTTTIPDRITEPYPVTYTADPADEIAVELQTNGDPIDQLPVDRTGDTTFMVTVPVAVPSGYYRLVFIPQATAGDAAPIHRTREFLISDAVATTDGPLYGPGGTDTSSSDSSDTTSDTSTDSSTTTDSTTPDDTDTSQSDSSSDTSSQDNVTDDSVASVDDSYASDQTTDEAAVTDDYQPTDQTDNEAVVTNDYQPTDQTDNQAAVTDDWVSDDQTEQEAEVTDDWTRDDPARATSAAEDTTNAVTDERDANENDPLSEQSPLVAFAPRAPDAFTGWVEIPLLVDASVQRVELLARPIRSLNAQHVTMARERSSGWVFAFDSTSLPNGRYELIAQARTDTDDSASDSLLVRVENEPARIPNTPTADVSEVEAIDRALATEDELAATSARPVLQLPDNESRSPRVATTSPVRDTGGEPIVRSRPTEDLIAQNRAELNRLLERYAAAVQTGDPIAIAAVEATIEETRNALIRDAVNEAKVETQLDALARELEDFTNEMQRRIETFETLRRERSQGTTAVDTDRDGISDYDEQVLYGTDPLASDTDVDGVSDGIEIARGYDPLSATPEVAVQYESPRDTVGLERADSLAIKNVQPVVSPETPEVPGVTAARIEGTALPNSFVRLFIFSTPTVVTVKTDADGSFVYTFEKELADGEHEVYVAITDNGGTIIAQSSPFRFIKEATAFTPAAAAGTNFGTAAAIEPPAPAYQTAAGVGMIALGGMLLMLGVVFRLSIRPESPAETKLLEDKVVVAS